MNFRCSFFLRPFRRNEGLTCGCLFEARLAGGSLKRSNNKRTLFSVNIRLSFYCSSFASAVTHRDYIDYKSHRSIFCLIRIWLWCFTMEVISDVETVQTPLNDLTTECISTVANNPAMQTAVPHCLASSVDEGWRCVHKALMLEACLWCSYAICWLEGQISQVNKNRIGLRVVRQAQSAKGRIYLLFCNLSVFVSLVFVGYWIRKLKLYS